MANLDELEARIAKQEQLMKLAATTVKQVAFTNLRMSQVIADLSAKVLELEHKLDLANATAADFED